MDCPLSDLCVTPSSRILDAVSCIDRNQKGIVLVTDEHGSFVGTITDGDVRRAMLAGEKLDAPVSELLARKDRTIYPAPITAPLGTDNATLLEMMKGRGVRQIPILDERQHVAGLVTLEELTPDHVLPLHAVIMAGGFGTRLLPLTEDMPKPMLPVGDRPLMQHIVEQLRAAGIRRVNVTTHYRPDKIIEHFGDGQAFGVELSYVNEDRPLGTAGALGLLEAQTQPMLVINGDILTQVDFRAMLEFHREHHADMTVAVRRYDLQVPYGVVESHGAQVIGVTEKPLLPFQVNAGIYLLEPSAQEWIPQNETFHMTDLVARLLANGRPVVCFPVREYWVDIGQLEDYERAQADNASRGGL